MAELVKLVLIGDLTRTVHIPQAIATPVTAAPVDGQPVTLPPAPAAAVIEPVAPAGGGTEAAGT